MPAQSKQQQKFMGIVHAIQKGDMKPSDASPEAQQAAKDMKPSDVTDFASTKHKGLPKKVKQEILKKLKEYAMTLPGHHMKHPAPNVPLRNDRDMDLEEGKGRDLATTLIRNARNSMRRLSDNDVEEFRKEIALAFDLKESINELMLARDVDSKMKELGISKIPISSQGEKVLNGMVKEKFLDKVTNKERLIYFVESLGKEKFGYGSKGKPLSPLVDRFWNDITSDAIFFGGKMAAYQVAMNMKDRKRNREELDSPYEMMKEYFKNFGMNHSGSRVFDSALRNLEDWMKRNNIKESRIPTNFNVGTTQDYHTKLATTPREDYDETNFNPEDSGQPDLEESFNELEHLKLLNLAMKAMPGSPKQKEIIKKLNQVRIAGGMKPIKESSIIKESVKKSDYINGLKDLQKTVKSEKGPFQGNNGGHLAKMYYEKALKMGMDNKFIDNLTRKRINSYNKKAFGLSGGSLHNAVVGGIDLLLKNINEYASNLDNSYILNKDAQIEKMNEGLMIRRAVDIAQEILPKDTWSKFASDGKKNAEFVKNVVRDLTQLLNRFYKSHDINVRLKEGEEDGGEIDMVLGVLAILRQVEDKENRKRMAMDIIQKFKEDDVDFDYKEFLELMNEYKKMG